ncbi:MAG: hypothetical protein ACRD15_02130, partial [Vicinamibacterales bacterium]
ALARNDGSLVGADVVIRDRIENTMRLVSRNIAGALADGWSAGAAISDDGGTIVFSSTATDLVPGLDANGLRSDIYLFRADTSLIQRISLNVVGLQPSTGSSMAPSVSAEGRYVAFTSTAELVSPSRAPRTADPESPGRSVSHVYVRDTQLHQTTRVAPKDRVPNGSSMSAVISRDGRFVAFVSQATNLVADDRNRSTDVFLFDRSTGSIALVSRNMAGRPANGASGNPSVSSDSRLVAFQSDASDLTCADGCRSLAEDINLVTDVFLFDRSTSTVTQISGGAGGWMEESVAPAVDATGQVVAFTSRHPIDAWDVDDDFDLFLQVSSAPR